MGTNQKTIKLRKVCHVLAMAAETMILVGNVSASYGKIKCFFYANLKVDTGTVCGLLGPSGCGKTTLLSCILGRKCMDSGTILVNGQPPGVFVYFILRYNLHHLHHLHHLHTSHGIQKVPIILSTSYDLL